ncbi:MAG: hypothetical protein Q9211_001970 [Gyalolechia sp. 1 TL-2023]
MVHVDVKSRLGSDMLLDDCMAEREKRRWEPRTWLGSTVSGSVDGSSMLSDKPLSDFRQWQVFVSVLVDSKVTQAITLGIMPFKPSYLKPVTAARVLRSVSGGAAHTVA